MAASFIPVATEADSRPMMEINTTPLIDVLLVLIIMLIITIPVQTHAVKMELPQGRGIVVDRLKNEIVISRDNATLWNGHRVSQPELAGLLHDVAELANPPEIHLRPDPDARYETVDQVLAIAKRQEVKMMGFVGNERYAAF